MSILIIAGAVLVLLLAGAGFLFGRRLVWKLGLMRSLSLRLLLVRLPRAMEKPSDPQKQAQEEINRMSQLLAALLGLKAPIALEVAVHHVGEEIHFYVAVPERALESASRQIQGFFPGALVERTDDYTIFNPTGAVRGAYLGLRKNPALPLRTYAEANVDTFLPILSSFSKLAAIGEGLALQVVLRPAPSGARKAARKYLEEQRKGKVVKRDTKEEQFKQVSIQDDDKIKLVQQKLVKPLLSANVRVIASAASQPRADELLEGVVQGMSQFGSPVGNELRATRPRNPQTLIEQFIFRLPASNQAMLLNTDELASMWHLPTAATEVPRLAGVRAREASPPQELAREGTAIGESVFRGEARRILLDDEDRRRHLYVIGQTGTGKSSLLTNMAAADIARGRGVAVIDPHGDLIDTILGLIPAERYRDVLVVDPGDLERPIGMNMLEYDQSKPEQKTFIVNEMISIFDKLYDLKTTGGPMFEQYMRNALILLMEDTVDGATLVEVPRVFSDAEFRKRKLARATNPTVIDFWEKEAIKAGGEASLANITPYVTSKFNTFIANDYVRPMIGQLKSAFRFREVMDQGKILLVNLSKGRIGDINANLLGMVIVGKILMAALSRVDSPQEERRDFNLYIDEFQNFATDSIATILSEARKYRLNLVIAHQFIAQLTEKIRDAVFGNVGSVVAFRVGADDAEFLEKQFTPVFSKSDLLNIDNFNAFARLLIGGATTPPFNIRTIRPEKGDPALAAKLRELSRLTYGKARGEVEADILRRLRT